MTFDVSHKKMRNKMGMGYHKIEMGFHIHYLGHDSHLPHAREHDHAHERAHYLSFEARQQGCLKGWQIE